MQTDIVRGPRKKRGYTIVDDQVLRDKTLSFRARGVLVYLLSMQTGWRVSADRLKDEGTEGRDAIRTALRELEAAGYLVRRRWRDPATKQWRSEQTVYEEPQRDTSSGDDQRKQEEPQVGPTADSQRPLPSASIPGPHRSTREVPEKKNVVVGTRARGSLELNPRDPYVPPPVDDPQQPGPVPDASVGVSTDAAGYRIARDVLPDQPDAVLHKLGRAVGSLRARHSDELIRRSLIAWSQQTRYGPGGLAYVLSEVQRADNQPRHRSRATQTLAELKRISEERRTR